MHAYRISEEKQEGDNYENQEAGVWAVLQYILEIQYAMVRSEFV
jgi:hypothetical protein